MVKVIESLKNRGSLLKGTAGKIVSPERGSINFLGPLLKIRLSLMKYLPMPLAKSVLITLGLTAAASAIAAAIQKNIYIYGSATTALIISNEEMKDILEIATHPKESKLLVKLGQ